MSDKKEKFQITEDNIFADLGLKNSEELLVRSELLSEVNRLIKNSELSQKEIAKILNISQPKVSMLTSGKLSVFSTDTLMHYLRLLGCNIEISLKPQRRISKATSRGRMVVRRNSSVRRRIKKRLQKL
ncbi:MAG: XRE family transcriptional regulator [Verrucomicrobia bacterium]|nr:XRE family transcriptional regulator [Verrucomicrobiota bacterium]